MTTILGLDISSFQIDACLLVDGQPPVLRREVLGKASEPLIERLRRVPAAMTAISNSLWRVYGAAGARPDWVIIEDPGSLRYANLSRALFTTLGAITACIPAECEIGWRMASEWRHDLGAKNTKAAGHLAIRKHYWGDDPTEDLDEHQMDALGIALAWSKILGAQDAR